MPNISINDCITNLGVRYHFENDGTKVTQCNMVTNVRRNQKFVSWQEFSNAIRFHWMQIHENILYNKL